MLLFVFSEKLTSQKPFVWIMSGNRTKSKSKRKNKTKRYSSPYTKSEINKLLDIGLGGQNDILYHVSLNNGGAEWKLHTEIATQTKSSPFWNNLICKCKTIPSKLKSHKDLMERAELMSQSVLSVSFEVTVNDDPSSLIIFPMIYEWNNFRGHPIRYFAKDIVSTYKKMSDLPINPDNYIININQVCDILFFVHYISIDLYLRNCV